MNKELLIVLGAAVLALGLFVVLIVRRRKPRKQIKSVKFEAKWQELQKMCASKETWPDAVRAADNLLAQALKKKRITGKSTGERLTKAQRLLSDNEGVWFGHKLRTSLDNDSKPPKLTQTKVKRALVGIRQALKDLGAITDKKVEKSDDK